MHIRLSNSLISLSRITASLSQMFCWYEGKTASIRRQVYRKPTWVGQYTNFKSFVSLSFKRNLIRCLNLRARRICTSGAISEDLEYYQETWGLNQYLDGLLSKCLQETSPKSVHYTVDKKTHLLLCFKDDTLNEIITMELNKALRITFSAAQLRITYATHPILPQQVEDKPSGSTCVYKFDCSCGVSHLGLTTRRWSLRMKEHHPAWLIKGKTGKIRSSIVQHLVESGHQINPDDAFFVFHQVPPNLPRPVKFRTVCVAEAVDICILKPALCVSIQISHPLPLPCPDI